MDFKFQFYPDGTSEEGCRCSVLIEADEKKFSFGKFFEIASVNVTRLTDIAMDAAFKNAYFVDVDDPDTGKTDQQLAGVDLRHGGKLVYGYDGSEKAADTYFSAYDAVAAALYSLIDYFSIYVKETANTGVRKYFLLKDVNVTVNIEDEEYPRIVGAAYIEDNVGICGARFISEENSGMVVPYFMMTKVVDLNDTTIPRVSSASFGIGLDDPQTQYAGSLKHFGTYYTREEYCEYTTETDADGNKYREYISGGSGQIVPCENFDKVVHLICKRNGDDFSFISPFDNVAYCKIKKEGDTLTFYHTPFDFRELPYGWNNLSFAENGELTQEGSKANIVFKKGADGKYHTKEVWLNSAVVYRGTIDLFGGIINDDSDNAPNIMINGKPIASPIVPAKAFDCELTLPPLPEGDFIDEEVLRSFYEKCVRALYDSVETAKEFITTRYEWEDPAFFAMEKWAPQMQSDLGSDNPPDCQETYTRGSDGLYGFRIDENTVMNVSASVPCDEINFEDMFLPDFPKFTFENITFTTGDKTVTLSPIRDKEDQLLIKLGDVEQPLAVWIVQGLDLGKDFPENPRYSKNWSTAKTSGSIAVYQKIRDAVERFVNEHPEVMEELKLELGGGRMTVEEVRSILYLNDRFIADEDIVKQVYDLYCKYFDTGEIPNLMILGQAGTGKTKLAKNIAKIFDKGLLNKAPADLKGAYIGHTKFTTMHELINAANGNQVLLLDEAYELMNDTFGREAVTLLLPMMSGDKKQLSATLDKVTIEVDFEKGKKTTINKENQDKEIRTEEELKHKGIVPVWFSGYENEVRSMISRNQGLYRRLHKIVIKNPVTSVLLDNLENVLDKSVGKIPNPTIKNRVERLKEAIFPKDSEGRIIEDSKCRKAVGKLFSWGIQPQNSKYFASYAGVSMFASKLLYSINYKLPLENEISRIISEIKIDIKRQLAAGRQALEDDDIKVVTDLNVRFKDLVGCKDQIAYMRTIIEMLFNRTEYEQNDITLPKGALMEGPPGTGKTFIAKAMAGELQHMFQNYAPDKRFGFLSFSASELTAKSIDYIASIFNAAEEYDACIMFIDEVDAIAKNRLQNNFFAQYLELIKQMDGIESRSNVFILAATNAPHTLDPAFVRTGRIDEKLVFSLPEKEDREELARRSITDRVKSLVSYTRDEMTEKKDISTIAKIVADKTPYSTAGDINSIINTAFTVYRQFKNYFDKISENDPIITADSFKGYENFVKENKKKRVLTLVPTKKQEDYTKKIINPSFKELFLFIDEGIERKRMGALNYLNREDEFKSDKNDNSCSSTAIHEVGHAMINLMQNTPIDQITSVARGDALGYVSFGSDTKLITKTDYENRIRTAMGGRAAEEIVFGKNNISTGAYGDMGQASYFARLMVECLGFSDEFGFLQLSASDGNYLGSGGRYTCSESYREKSDNAVNELLKRLYDETLKMLWGKKDIILSLAKEVFDKETLTGNEFKKVYDKELKRRRDK